MSASVELRSEGALPVSFAPSDDALSELGDGSSSLSDIEDKEAEQEGVHSADFENDADSDANDSEAETERLENSPHQPRKQKDVVLSSQAESRTYERSPSKLQHQFSAEAQDEDDNILEDLSDEDLDDEDLSLNKSPKSSDLDGVEQELTTATTSLEDSSGEGKAAITAADTGFKKRKRSQLLDQEIREPIDLDEPSRKRTGSIVMPADEYAIEDTTSINGDLENSNPVSGNLSDAESLEGQDDDDNDNQQEAIAKANNNEETRQATNHAASSKTGNDRKIGRKKRKDPDDEADPTVQQHQNIETVSAPNKSADEAMEGDEVEDAAEVYGDEAEIAAKTEEEQEKKRVAMDQLIDIERHFASFRDRLYEERLAQLEAEEAMLKADKPIHPEYLAMLQCIDARRDERIRLEARDTQLRSESIKRSAIAIRSQIMTQFYQEVRDIRERHLELLGKQWYEIQHDRRGYGSNVEEYALKFPIRKSQQNLHHLAYNTEVSVLSGVAKYVGFPAAPPMAPATPAEADQDFEKMHRSQRQHQSQRVPPNMLLPELAALRAATSTTSFKPAEEQFIEQTPWANPQHPSHAHTILHQTLGHQSTRISSPFSASAAQGRRHSHQHIGTPVSGTFSGAAQNVQPHTNGAYMSGGRRSPMNPFSNMSQKIAPSPLGSRQTSLSPQQNRSHPHIPGNLERQGSAQTHSRDEPRKMEPSGAPDAQEQSSSSALDTAITVEREPLTSLNGRF